MASVDENLEATVESLKSFCEGIKDELSESGNESLGSLIDAFRNKEITYSVLSKSIQLLFKTHGNKTKQDSVEEGEIRENVNDCAVRATKVGESSEKSGGAHVGIRAKVDVSDEPKSEKYVTDKMGLDGKKRRIIHTEQIESSTVKKPRKSRRLDEVTPSYERIPEEKQCPVSNNDVLNNKYSVMQFKGATKHKPRTKYEEAMESCEDEMFRTDMLIESLKSAVESAEKVITEKMSVEDLKEKFYRCIETLYRGDMSEIVKKDHKKALPVILERLKQKLDEHTVARESLKPRWKQFIAENTAKQREAATRKKKN